MNYGGFGQSKPEPAKVMNYGGFGFEKVEEASPNSGP
jgi:hypothetical protein